MRFTGFHVTNYRNIHDSGPIDVGQITAFVGQNESGKSNLFEALYRVNPFDEQAEYNINEDWPVDRWAKKTMRPNLGCQDYPNFQLRPRHTVTPRDFDDELLSVFT